MKLKARHAPVHISIAALSTLVLLLLTTTAQAEGGASIRLSAARLNLGLGREATVDVLVYDVPVVYGADVRLSFDPSQLEVVDADEDTPGIQVGHDDFIDPAESFVLQNQADNAEGVIDYATTLLNPAPPVQGSGVLARITFRAKVDGWATVYIDEALLGTQTGQTIAPAIAPVQPVSFTVSFSALTVPATVSFTNTSGGSTTAVLWDFGDGTSSTLESPTHTYTEPGLYPAILTVADASGDQSSALLMIPLDNLPPRIDEIVAPTVPLLVNSTITANASFSDTGLQDTHSAIWDWGDGNTSPGVVAEVNGSGTVHGDHTYTEPGVYTIHLTVADHRDGVGEATFRYVVIYNPEGTFVTGNGQFDSPAGACPADPLLTDDAKFGFNIKYEEGEVIPTGHAKFDFKATDFEFDADDYEWLVVFGARSWFRGTGIVNDESGYQFLVTAIDGDLDPNDNIEEDRFRIKIWYEDGNGAETIVYDNGFGSTDFSEIWTTELAGGNILIHHMN